jgi:hypothetical protein
MKQKIKERKEELLEEDNSEDGCPHFWDIESANGPSSQGVCRRCGETRDFYNAFPEFNPLRRKNNPLDLPKISDVEVDEESKS